MSSESEVCGGVSLCIPVLPLGESVPVLPPEECVPVLPPGESVCFLYQYTIIQFKFFNLNLCCHSVLEGGNSMSG